MDVRVGADTMEIELIASIASPEIAATIKVIFDHNINPSVGPALAPAIISIGNHSISAIAPDFITEKEFATV